MNIAPGHAETVPLLLPLGDVAARVVITCFSESEPAFQVMAGGVALRLARVEEIPTWWSLFSRKWRKWRVTFTLPLASVTEGSPR